MSKCCENCENLITIGEGDHICIEGTYPRMVLSYYVPTDEYYWCGGRKWEEN